ncbi:MAG: hypothetical protein ACI9G1_003439, partial [Pirellulaceae bacterium]
PGPSNSGASTSGAMPSQSAFPSLENNESARQQTPQPLFPQQSIPQSSTGHQPIEPLTPLGHSSNPFQESQQPQKPNPFADAPSNPYNSPTATMRSRQISTEDAKGRVIGPAIAMMIVSVIVMLFIGLMCLAVLVKIAEEGFDDDDIPVFIVFFIMFATQGIVALGAFRMMSLKNYGLAMTAAIISLACGLGSCLQLGFGIWALIVLADAQVREKFT